MKTPSLKQIQSNFASAIQEGCGDGIFIKSDSPDERLSIYRNNVQEVLIKALSTTFPGTLNLLGAECFKAAILSFCKDTSNLPANGCLDFWGEKFPDFLQSLEALSALPYIKDYAQYEWTKASSYMLGQEDAIDAKELSSIDETKNIILELQDHMLLFSSEYPIDKIDDIATNKSEDELSLTKAEVFCMITKHNSIWVSKPIYYFMRSLKNYTLSYAYEEALGLDQNFDLTRSLIFLLNNNLITKIKITEKLDV